MTIPAGLLAGPIPNWTPPPGGAPPAPQPIPNWTPPPGGAPPTPQPIPNAAAPMPAIPLAPAMQTVLEALTRAHAQGNPHAAPAIASLARAVQHGAQR